MSAADVMPECPDCGSRDCCVWLDYGYGQWSMSDALAKEVRRLKREEEGGARVTAPSAVYVTCLCGGRAEVDPSNPGEGVECYVCGREWSDDLAVVHALKDAGFVLSERHGWRTDADIQADSWNCECEDCHQGEVPRW